MSDASDFPSYRKHSSGRARVTLFDVITGKKKDVMLGQFGTAKSRAEYFRVIGKWEAAGRRLDEPIAADLTINEMLVPYLAEAQTLFREPDGTEKRHLYVIRLAVRTLRETFGHLPAAEFGPLKLKEVRNKLLASGLVRSHVNARVNIIRRVFKWAVANEMIPPSVFHGLQAVEGLRYGQGRETEPIKPVPLATVEATLPHMTPTVATIIRLLVLTGARIGEIVIMRTCDLETSGRVWVYRPATHKTRHHGKVREIYIGPKAQEVLKPWLKLDLQAYLFSPKEAVEAWNAERGRQRQTPRWPSHMRRNRRKRKGQKLNEHYDRRAIGWAIKRACRDAFPPPEPIRRRDDETKGAWEARLSAEEKAELKKWEKAHKWHVHQIRHLAATLIRKEHGIEAARIILGHSSAFTTEIYAETDKSKAIDAIGRIG
jgi:integrase